MDILKKIEAIIEAPLDAKGYDIVRLLMIGNTRRVMQIMIENKDERPITLEDCETVSRTVSVLLDQHEPISGAFNLEVSSAGLDRPLVKAKDYQRFLGHIVVVKTHVAIDNRKTFHGPISEASDDNVTVAIDKAGEEEQQLIVIPFSNIKSARLYVNFNA